MDSSGRYGFEFRFVSNIACFLRCSFGINHEKLKVVGVGYLLF